MAETMGYAGADVSGLYAASQLAAGGGRGNRRPPAAYRLLFAAAALILMTSAAFAADTLPFIEDDYAKAVARAKAKNVPIFVEAWAPW
jgi:hypothetical protein